jgi:hypothetical protein
MMRTAYLALFTVGFYYAWRNRFQIQRFLESKGVSIPLDTSNVGNTIRSGFAKVTGQGENLINQADRDTRRAV